MTVGKRILDIVKKILIVFLIIFIICFGSIVYQKKILKNPMPNLFGYVGGTIVSGSMIPNINIGDYVIAKVDGNYEVNDVVMFKRETSYIAHRVIKINDKTILTKGDNNESEDPEVSKDKVVGPVVKVFKGLGTFITYLSKFKFFIFFIFILVIILL